MTCSGAWWGSVGGVGWPRTNGARRQMSGLSLALGEFLRWVGACRSFCWWCLQASRSYELEIVVPWHAGASSFRRDLQLPADRVRPL